MPESRRESLERFLEPNSLVDRLPEPRQIAIVLGIGIVLLGIAGAAVGTDAYQGEGSIWDRMFSLANEKTVPAFFSGAINLAGGLCAMVAARARLYGMHRIWIAFGVLLTFMAVDEVVQIHERVEAWTGVDWEQPYAVIALGGAFVWFNIVRRMEPFPRWLMIGGALGWMISFGLEDAEYDSADHRAAGFTTMTVIEELAEMAGSGLWLLAIVVALKAHARTAPEPEAESAPRYA